MAASRRVYDSVGLVGNGGNPCCHLQANCLESGISSGPLRSTMSMGTFKASRQSFRQLSSERYTDRHTYRHDQNDTPCGFVDGQIIADGDHLDIALTQPCIVRYPWNLVHCVAMSWSKLGPEVQDKPNTDHFQKFILYVTFLCHRHCGKYYKKLCYRKEDSESVVHSWFSSLSALFSATYRLDIPDFSNWCLSRAHGSSIGHISAFWQGTSHRCLSIMPRSR